MTLKVSSAAQAVFFEKVFGEAHSLTVLVKSLIAKGVQFETTLYTITATKEGKVSKLSLTKGTTSLMKGSLNEVFIHQNKQMITSWVMNLPKEFLVEMEAQNLPQTGGSTPPKAPISLQDEAWIVLTSVNPNKMILTIKVIREVSGLGLLESKQVVDAVTNGKVTQIPFKFTPIGAYKALGRLEKECGAAGYLSDKAGVNLTSLQKETVKFGGANVYAQTDEGIEFVGTVQDAQVGKEKPTVTAVKNVTTGQVLPVVESKPKPVDMVIPLRDAKAIGQKVKGTSSGSVYYCIALNDQIRLAARIYKSGSISIRAEWSKDAKPEDLKRLEEAGLGMKGNYASMHLDAGSVPVERVIGAVVLGTGIKWHDLVMGAPDLHVVEV